MDGKASIKSFELFLERAVLADSTQLPLPDLSEREKEKPPPIPGVVVKALEDKSLKIGSISIELARDLRAGKEGNLLVEACLE